MNLEAGKITMVFVKEFDGRKTYSIGLSRKIKMVAMKMDS
jgi:hypothetical protein